MASGILGQSAPSATSYTTIYTVPSTTYAVANISIANRESTSMTVRVALASGSTPTNAEFIEYETTIPGYGVLERTGISMESGKRIVVYISNANASVSVYGIEQSTV
jgi:hypothetical protein